jgi:hypothetical protein
VVRLNLMAAFPAPSGEHGAAAAFPSVIEFALIGEPINRALEVDLDGEEVTMAVYDWFSGETQGGH